MIQKKVEYLVLNTEQFSEYVHTGRHEKGAPNPPLALGPLGGRMPQWNPFTGGQEGRVYLPNNWRPASGQPGGTWKLQADRDHVRLFPTTGLTSLKHLRRKKNTNISPCCPPLSHKRENVQIHTLYKYLKYAETSLVFWRLRLQAPDVGAWVPSCLGN